MAHYPRRQRYLAQSLGNVQAVMARAGSPEIGPTPAVAVSTDPASNLHVVVLDEQDQAWHTYRAPSGPWPQAWYGIKAAI